MKIRVVGAELPYTNGRTDMTKLTVACHNFAEAYGKACECVCAGSCARARACFARTNHTVVFKNGTFKHKYQGTRDNKKNTEILASIALWASPVQHK
jgi:hypothetical protein